MATLTDITSALEALQTAINNLNNIDARTVTLENYVINGLDDGTLGLLERVAALEEAICLRKGTQILMADGTTKAIEQIKPNEMIASWDLENRCLIPSKVYAAVFTGRGRNWRSMIFDNGSTLDIYGSHQIYCVEEGMPYPTKRWECDMHSLAPDGTEIAYSFGSQENVLTMIPYEKYALFCDTGLYFANNVLCGHRLGEALTSYYMRSKSGFELTEDEIAELTTYALEYDSAHDAYLRNENYLKEAMPHLKKRGAANKKIEKYKKELEKRDYKTIKDAQGVLSEEESILNKSECEAFRAKIAEQESEMATAQVEIDALREKHSAYGTSYVTVIKKQLKEAAEKARKRYGAL